MEEYVVLVDHQDNQTGLMEKIKAHEKAMLHRAFSIFIFNTRHELMIQQRAFSKYHTPGLWTNTCCSHPRNGESLKDAAKRRLKEEMGISCELKEAFHFIYKADVGQGLIEHELDHVFIGITDELPLINCDEVASWKYDTMEHLRLDIAQHPGNYTVWFKKAFEEVVKHSNK